MCVIPHLAFLHTQKARRRLAVDSLSISTGTMKRQASARAPPAAAEDLLISSPGCGRTAGCCSGAAVGSGVRSRANFTCGWVRISICSASTPHHARAKPALPPSLPLFTRSASRRRATAPWHANARRAAPWFDRRAVPRALL